MDTIDRTRALGYLLAGGLGLLSGCAAEPAAEVFEARQALAIARDYEADIYAPEEYEFALFNLRAAEDEIDRQLEASPWARTYSSALDQLELAVEQATLAQEVASSVKEESYLLAEERIPEAQRAFLAAEEEVVRAREARIAFTQLQTLQADLSIAADTLRSGREAFENGDYLSATTQVEAAKQQADIVREAAIRLIGLSAQ